MSMVGKWLVSLSKYQRFAGCLNGINVKYRYEFTDTLGLITSFSYANAEDEQKTHYSDTRWHEDSVRNRWFSVMAGPSVRVNEWFSAYAMAGMAYSRVSTLQRYPLA
ncbi:hypothetical protein BZL31_20850 [Escherichia coli]|nr:hypothetical protein BZL31_20850 [Escherichia coli]